MVAAMTVEGIANLAHKEQARAYGCLGVHKGVEPLSGASGRSGIGPFGSVPPRVPAEEGTMDRVDEDRRTRNEGVTEDSPPTGRTVISRRAALGGAAAGALVTLLARPELASAQASGPPTLVVLLRGLYEPVVDGPDSVCPRLI